MCFHTRTAERVAKVEQQFKVSISDPKLINLFDTPQYHLNGFTHPNMLVIPQERPKVLAPGVWGIAPPNTTPDGIKAYYKEAVRYGGGLNAQSEKLFQHFIYKHSALTRRCIIPVSGFFEPHEYLKKKYPFYIHHKEDDLLGLAGLYTIIGTYITFTILTKTASPLFSKIHNLKKRQPVILADTSIDHWLNPELSAPEIQRLLQAPYPETKLEAYPVSKDLFSSKVETNVPTITQRMAYAELPKLL
jgi:putative SOS response-associated peptidase YedK